MKPKKRGRPKATTPREWEQFALRLTPADAKALRARHARLVREAQERGELGPSLNTLVLTAIRSWLAGETE